MAPARADSLQLQVSERLVLIPAIDKRNTTGYKNVTFDCKLQKFMAQARDGGKNIRLGYFDTAEEAATAYARSESGRADAAKLLQPRAAPTAAGAAAVRQAEMEGLTLDTSSNNSSGYKNVIYDRSRKKYKLDVRIGGKKVCLGCFATAEEAALFNARREAGRDMAAREAVQQAGREGLTLASSSSSNSGYRGVTFKRKDGRSKKYQLHVRVSGKQNFLGCFATAEEAALARARLLWDMTVRLLEPQPQQAPPQGTAAASGLDLSVCSDTEKTLRNWRLLLQTPRATQQGGATCVGTSCAPTASSADATRGRGKERALPEQDDAQAPPQGAAGPSEEDGYYEEEDGFDPTDIAEAVTLSLLPNPPSASEQREARRQAHAAEQAARAAAAVAAAAQAAADAAPPWDDEVEVEVEQESDSEESESEMEVEAGAAARAASAAAEETECAICLDDLSAHPEARLQRRDPNGWGATRCCKSLFHYCCLHTWLSDDSEVETSRGMEPINTACPCCRGFVSKSASRMLD